MTEWLNWTLENSTLVRNFSLIIAAVIGLFFLIWRSVSADRSAKAALKQAQATLEQIKISTRQSEAAVKQSEAATQQSAAAVKQAETSAEQQITNIFSQAVEQLGHNESAIVRTGAVYTLERIAQTSSLYRQAIINLLVDFVRENAPLSDIKPEVSRIDEDQIDTYQNLIKVRSFISDSPRRWSEMMLGEDRVMPKSFVQFSEKQKDEIRTFLKSIAKNIDSLAEWTKKIHLKSPQPEIQAIISVLGGLRIPLEHLFFYVNLSQTDLRGVSFSACNFNKSAFMNCDLRGCQAIRAHFQNCSFAISSFSGSILNDSSFNKSNLSDTDFTGALLTDTSFHGANLSGANFGAAIDLTQEQLKDAYGDDQTILPEGLSIEKNADKNKEATTDLIYTSQKNRTHYWHVQDETGENT